MSKGEFYDSLEKLTIAEAVDLLRREGYDVSTHKLRQYEKQKLLSPEKASNKYRLYSALDLNTLRTILSLLTLGFSLKNIKKSLDLSRESYGILNKFVDIDIEKELVKSKYDGAVLSDEKLSAKNFEIITNKWTEEEANKNYLILSKFCDFMNNMLEVVDQRQAMLERLRHTQMDDIIRRVTEQILKIIKQRTFNKREE